MYALKITQMDWAKIVQSSYFGLMGKINVMQHVATVLFLFFIGNT
jgi:hypothetical protein